MFTFRKSLVTFAAFAGLIGAAVVGTALPAAAQGWGHGPDRGWDRPHHGGWDRPHHGGWRHHRDWDRPRCWVEPRRVWVETRWGPRQRISDVRVCR